METEADKKVKLITAEGEEILVEREVAAMSGVVRTMLEDSNDAIPLPQVKGVVLQKILDYCRYHLNHPGAKVEVPKPLPCADLAEVVCSWDAEFVNMEQGMLNDVIIAANFMDIKPLLELSCAAVACRLKGKTPEEIRRQFNIKNDFTPEEEAQVLDENKWCEEA